MSLLQDPEQILNMVIWGNSLIKRNNRPIFDPNLVNSNIERIFDIYKVEDHRFYTHEEITSIYGTVIDELFYYGILAAIPRIWKHILKNYVPTNPLDLDTRIDQKLKGSNPSRQIYWTLLENKFPIHPTSKYLWESELGCAMSEDHWWSLYPLTLKCAKMPKLRYFQYRLLNKALTTNVMHNRWNKQISDLCIFLCRKKRNHFTFAIRMQKDQVIMESTCQNV